MKRRRVLLTIAGLGSVVALLGLTGLIAPFTDRATTGTNSIESGERAKEVDLQLALFDPSMTPFCGPFTDDLATGLISASNVQPGDSTLGTTGPGVCVKNAGASNASVAITALDVSDVDTACTGDEAAVDTTCGNGGAGELSPHLVIGFHDAAGFLGGECTAPPPIPGVASPLDVLAATSTQMFALAPGQVACLRSSWAYQPTTASDAAVAQTDQATWRFAFDGATP
jgi:hypothetical protein